MPAQCLTNFHFMSTSDKTSSRRGVGCKHCRDDKPLDFSFTMAFQPIVDLRSREVFAYEALVRGTDGAGAASVLGQVTDDNRYRFDQDCRARAVELAARLQIPCLLSINFLPNAVYEAATCIRATLAAARRFNFPADRIIFEVTEGEEMSDKNHLQSIFTEYKRQGFLTAIDDFGAGYSGLNLLAEFQPDILKLDMALVRNLHQDPVREAIVKGVLGVCDALNIKVIAEGVEVPEELRRLRDLGVYLFQGYLLARPAFEALPSISWPED
tara:strand:+ start:327 stop:1133 length:807 start_codon:yes stop_codon:yes gene_type:complete